MAVYGIIIHTNIQPNLTYICTLLRNTTNTSTYGKTNARIITFLVILKIKQKKKRIDLQYCEKNVQITVGFNCSEYVLRRVKISLKIKYLEIRSLFDIISTVYNHIV